MCRKCAVFSSNSASYIYRPWLKLLREILLDGLEGFVDMFLLALMVYVLGIWLEHFGHHLVLALRRPNGERWQYFRNGLGNAFADAVADYRRLLNRVLGRVED
ncbi:hypothetical protein GGI35DRAFT_435527, partial [Trichoderma velutinum]